MLIPDFDGICRLCMTESEKMVPIFNGKGKAKPSLKERIQTSACLKVVKGDGLPNAVCSDCMQRLDEVEEFQEQCKSADATLRQFLSAQRTDLSIALASKKEERKTQINVKRRRKSKRISPSQRQITRRCINSKQESKDCSVEELDLQEPSAGTASSVSTSGTDCDPLEDCDDSDPQRTCVQIKSVIMEEKSLVEIGENSECLKKDNDCSETEGGDNEDKWPGGLSIEDIDQNHSTKISEINNVEKVGLMKSHKKKVKKSFVCEYCGREFARSNHLAQHELTHTKEKPFRCSYCQKSFWYKNSLIGHIKQAHTGDVNFTCDECGRGFYQRAEFNRHLPTHSNDTPFKCDECGMSFKLTKNLKRHQKVHIGIRTHTCQYCGKSFRMLQTLKVHLLLHSGEKPFKCTYCGKSFTQSAPLKAHTRLHTGERPYVCSFCGEAFPTGNSLKAHIFKHTGIHPNSCKDCSLVFKRKRDLLDHQNRVHGGASTAPLEVTPQLPIDEPKGECDLEPSCQQSLQMKRDQQQINESSYQRSINHTSHHKIQPLHSVSSHHVSSNPSILQSRTEQDLVVTPDILPFT